MTSNGFRAFYLFAKLTRKNESYYTKKSSPLILFVECQKIPLLKIP